MAAPYVPRTDQDLHDELTAMRPSSDPKGFTADILRVAWEEESYRRGTEPPSRDECVAILLDTPRMGDMARQAFNSANYKRLQYEMTEPREVHASLTRVPEFLDGLMREIEPALRDLAHGRVTFKSWEPPSGTPHAYVPFLKNLRIPCITATPGTPNLLLHDLGSFTENAEVKARVDSVFSSTVTYLCNASGAGKTRTLLEGLTQHWGFYFTLARGSKAIGSDDWGLALSGLSFARGFRDDISMVDEDVRGIAIADNHDIVGRRVDAALLARLRVFQLFLKQIPAERTPAEEMEFRKRWLILQLDPRILPLRHDHDPDIFAYITKYILRECDKQPMERHLREWVSQAIADILPGSSQSSGSPIQNSTFHIVIDEAQSAARLWKSAFRSAKVFERVRGEPQRRSLLRAILVNIAERIKHRPVYLVPTGTNVSQEDFGEAVASAGALVRGDQQSVRYTGGIENCRAMKAHVSRFLPPDFLSSDSGRRLLRRMSTWLVGRFRLTDQFLSILLQQGLRSPHSVLNSYIYAYGECKPTDADDMVAQESPYDLDTIGKHANPKYEMNYDALKEDSEKHALVVTLARPMVFNYLLRSTAETHIAEEYSPLMVEVGFGRYATRDDEAAVEGGGKCASVNEPLVIMQLAAWFEKVKSLTAYHYFAEMVGTNEIRNKGNGWENYIAHCLIRRFSQPAPLSSIFDIRASQAHDFQGLMDQTAEIVGIIRPDAYAVANPDTGMDTDTDTDADADADADEEAADAPPFLHIGVVRNIRSPFAPVGVQTCQPTVTLGVTVGARDGGSAYEEGPQYQQTIDWLLKTPTPMLFPDNNFGPDLMMILRLEDGHLCWLAVQCKLLTPDRDRRVPAEQTSASVFSVTPRCLFKSFKRKTADANETRKNAAARHALQQLPNRTALAGDCSVIRVVALFPGAVDIDTVVDFDAAADVGAAADGYAQDPHPLVRINFARLRQVVDDLKPLNNLQALGNSKLQKDESNSSSRKARAKANEAARQRRGGSVRKVTRGRKRSSKTIASSKMKVQLLALPESSIQSQSTHVPPSFVPDDDSRAVDGVNEVATEPPETASMLSSFDSYLPLSSRMDLPPIPLSRAPTPLFRTGDPADEHDPALFWNDTLGPYPSSSATMPELWPSPPEAETASWRTPKRTSEYLDLDDIDVASSATPSKKARQALYDAD